MLEFSEPAAETAGFACQNIRVRRLVKRLGLREVAHLTSPVSFAMVADMNDTEKQIAEMLLKDVTLVNVADRLRDYHALLECADKRRSIESNEAFYRNLTATRAQQQLGDFAPKQNPTPEGPTGIAAIDNA